MIPQKYKTIFKTKFRTIKNYSVAEFRNVSGNTVKIIYTTCVVLLICKLFGIV